MLTTSLPRTDKQRRRLYKGSILNFRLLSKETNNSISIIDAWMPAGAAPSRHVHDHEDETLIVQGGELIFFLGESAISARKGDVVFAPRGVSHHFKITTPTCKLQVILTPGNIDQYFWQSSFPFDEDEVSGFDGPPSKKELEGMKRLAERYGMRML